MAVMKTILAIAMMAMFVKKATIVIWEPMSLVCAILAIICMHINDYLLEWTGHERPIPQRSTPSHHAKDHRLDANCSKEVCKLVAVHPERLFLLAFHQQFPELHRSAVAAIFLSSDWLLATVNVSCRFRPWETRAANLVAKLFGPSTWWTLAVQ